MEEHEAPALTQPAKKKPYVTRPRVYLSFPHNSDIPPSVLPGSLRVHPRGFRLLKGSSPLERRMNTYFRLPPRPTKNSVVEQRKALNEVAKHFPPPGRSSQGTHSVQLDGFILLEACGVQDPADAKECILNDSNLRGSAHEDLPYFTSLRILDLGENHVSLADLRGLDALEELHLHCNGLRTLDMDAPVDTTEETDADGATPTSSEVPFPRLATLNLSFNSIPYRELTTLSLLRSLERLDLSSNHLKNLPSDLSGLANVSQLALENNKFSDPKVLIALSTMPSLVEVNLNFNNFTSVPRLSMDDGVGVCFPVLQVIGLASNQLEYFEDAYALTQVSTLRRVVLWGNPVERKLKDCEILIYEFGAINVQVVLESPLPPKRKVGEFYAANTHNFVRVTNKELKPVPKRGVERKPQTAPESGTTAGATTQGEGGAGSFFVTQVGIETQGQPQHDARTEESRHRRAQAQPTDDTWFASTPHDSEPPSSAGAAPAVSRQPGVAGTRRVEAYDTHDILEGNMNATTAASELADWGPTPAGSRDDMCQPNAGVRAVMSELKRMLRQPLPPIHVPQFEQSTISKNMRKAPR